MKLVVPFILAACMATSASAQSGPAARGPTMLLHGNYCGPGNNAPLAPVDALDAACARHDACTPSGGLPSRACNARLQRDADLISRDPRQPDDLRTLAGLVSAGAGLIPSDTRLAAAPASSFDQGTHVMPNASPSASPARTTNGLDDVDAE